MQKIIINYNTSDKFMQQMTLNFIMHLLIEHSTKFILNEINIKQKNMPLFIRYESWA